MLIMSIITIIDYRIDHYGILKYIGIIKLRL